MVPDPAYCCYGLEYFCFEGDGTWAMRDDDLLAMAKRESNKSDWCGLAKSAGIENNRFVRDPVMLERGVHLWSVPRATSSV